MQKLESVKNATVGALLTYSTIKVVQVPNTGIAVVNRILQLIIIGYIIGYIVVWKKGYQEFQEPHGTSIIKVKGIAKATGFPSDGRILNTIGMNSSQYVWDVAEYEIPPIENNAFFIATRQTVTYGQTQTTCPTALDDKYFCDDAKNKTCPRDIPTSNTFGILTGNCVPSHQNQSLQVCEMMGWCPEEMASSTDYTINEDDLDNFTVYLKTIVSFTAFGKTLRNVDDKTNFSCRYDGTSATKNCPILPIGYILNKVDTDRPALLSEGGLIEIRQIWTCNFDTSPKSCSPTYEFNVLQSGIEKPSPGINYRFAHKYRVNDTDYRILQKMYGLRFVVTITGQGGQFNIVNLFVAIGSGISFLVIAGVVCDFILMYAHKYRSRYRQGKISVLEMDERPDTKILIQPNGSDV